MYGIEHATAIRTAVNVNVVRRAIRRLLPVDAVKIGEREGVVPAHSNEIRSKRSPGGKRASRNKERTRLAAKEMCSPLRKTELNGTAYEEEEMSISSLDLGEGLLFYIYWLLEQSGIRLRLSIPVKMFSWTICLKKSKNKKKRKINT